MKCTAFICSALLAMTAATSHADFDLRVTEIYFGNQENPDVTEDWFELTNFGDMPWTAAIDGDLYYDDASADFSTADLLSGVPSIAPGQSVIFVDDADSSAFLTAWANVPGLTVGTYSGAGLGNGGDTVNLWLGLPTSEADLPFESASYPAADELVGLGLVEEGATYDVFLGEFSTIGNAAGAVASVGLGGGADVLPRSNPTIGSPGSVPEPTAAVLAAIAAVGVASRRRG